MLLRKYQIGLISYLIVAAVYAQESQIATPTTEKNSTTEVATPSENLDDLMKEGREKAQKAREIENPMVATNDMKKTDNGEAARSKYLVWLSSGKSSSALGNASTFEIGMRGSGPWGGSITLIDNDETRDVDIGTQLFCLNLSSSCYTDLGAKRKGNTIGIDAKYFWADRDQAFQPFIGFGLYLDKTINVVQDKSNGKKFVKGSLSNVTQKDSEKSNNSGNLEVGALFSLGRLVLGGSVGTTKTQFSIGVRF